MSKGNATVKPKKPARSTAPKRKTKVQPKRVLKVAGTLRVSPGLVETIVNEYLNGER